MEAYPRSQTKTSEPPHPKNPGTWYLLPIHSLKRWKQCWETTNFLMKLGSQNPLTPGCSGSSWQGLAWSNPWCLPRWWWKRHPKVVGNPIPRFHNSLETNIFAPKKWGYSRQEKFMLGPKSLSAQISNGPRFFRENIPNCQVKHAFFSGNQICSLTSVWKPRVNEECNLQVGIRWLKDWKTLFQKKWLITMAYE